MTETITYSTYTKGDLIWWNNVQYEVIKVEKVNCDMSKLQLKRVK